MSLIDRICEPDSSGGESGVKGIRIRPVENSDQLDWLRLRQALWPTNESSHGVEVDRYFRGEIKVPEIVLVAELDGRLNGFAEFSVRAHAEGCVTDNVGYLEGVYVEPDSRGKGLGRALLEAGEAWARNRGCVEIASDANLGNDLSAKVHHRLGFEEVGRIRCFRKPLPSS